MKAISTQRFVQIHSKFLWLVVLLVLTAALDDSSSTLASDEEPTDTESLTSWRYFQELSLPVNNDSRWFDFVLTPSVFDAARLDLADLRLYDNSGNEIPYALRVRRRQFTSEAVEAREFNRASGPDGSSEVSLDLGADTIEHNEVKVNTAGNNFRRSLQLEGSDDGVGWSLLKTKNLLRFQSDGTGINDQTVSYTPSRFQYLRVRVNQDPLVDSEPVEFREITVRRHVEIPGEFVLRDVPFGPRQPVRADGGPGSAWFIDLGGDSVPCEKLLVQIADAEFVRDYHIEAGGPPGSNMPFRTIAHGTWRRRAGERSKPIVTEFSEVQAGRLRLVVTDHRNPPLTINSVHASAPVRQMVFAADDSIDGPLSLYFSNPIAESTHYDFARNLPEQLDPNPVRLKLASRQDNPLYQPDKLPLTERWPWLVYVLLALAVAVLGLLIVNLARAAIAVADARDASQDATYSA